MAKKLTFYAMLAALALIFSYVESLFSLNFIAPGVKLGLANCAAMLLLIRGDIKGAFLVNTVRILLSTLLFSAPTTLLFSLGGGLISLLGMWLLSKTRLFGAVGLCSAGGALHNAAQIIVALWFTGTPGLIYYLPILLIAGTVCGVLTGIVSFYMNKYIKTAF